MAKKNRSGSKKSSSGKADAQPTEHWTDQPQEHDYPAAASYLGLVSEQPQVLRLVAALRSAPVERHLAKDLLRASGLDLLPVDNAHVADDLATIRRGEKLSPVLLVRGDIGRALPLTIADGYHRVCASYYVDESEPIPCHLVDAVPSAAPPGQRGGRSASISSPGGSIAVN